jgi:hypothetical protein
MAAEYFYVQVRDPAERRWVAVAESADRHTAETLAESASPIAPGAHGRLPGGVRVMSSQDLAFEGGADAVTRAVADLREPAADSPTPR